MNHEFITSIVAPNGYGVGVFPNPFVEKQKEWVRRKEHAEVRKLLTDKIHALFEPRFITPTETAECIEAIVAMTDSRRILEIGTCTGFTTLHMLRAIYGKQGGFIVSIDARPAHDRGFWNRSEFDGILRHLEGWTPGVLEQLRGNVFDLVFVDSDHSVEHTQKELDALWSITRTGTIILFHDVPQWERPDHKVEPSVRTWLYEQVVNGRLHGVCLPSCEQMDCLDMWGDGYPKECNPGLGIFVRR